MEGGFVAMADGTRLWYHDSGGPGRAVLLHHGHTADRASWGFPTETLPQLRGAAVLLRDMGHRVIVMECRGAGASDDGPPGTHEIPQFARDVLAFLDHLCLEQVAFAGHSMGGAVGLHLALHHASRLSALVLVAPIPSRGIARLADVSADAEGLERLRAVPVRELRRYFFHRALLPEGERLAMRRAARWHPAETEAWLRHRAASEARCGHTLEGLRSMFLFSEEAERVEVPVLMLAAAGDLLLPENLADFARMPTATLHVVAHAGHELPAHAPREVAGAVAAFLEHGAWNYRQVAERDRLALSPKAREGFASARSALAGLLARSRL